VTPTPAEPVFAAPAERAAEALVAADRWSLWRTLSRGLAHRLANAAQMLALDPAPALARLEAAGHVTMAQARLSEVRVDGTPCPTLVPEVLEDLQSLQRLQSGFPSTDLDVQIGPGLEAVNLPAADLRHVLLALVTNAKQAAAGERARIRITARPAEAGVTIVIEDSGPGLPAGLHERAFEPYFTTREDDSLGLGLTVARTLVRRAGGTLEPEPGTSRFVLRLPPWRRAR